MLSRRLFRPLLTKDFKIRRRFFRPLLTKDFKMRLQCVADSFRYMFSMKRYRTPFLGTTRFVSSQLLKTYEHHRNTRVFFIKDPQAKKLKRSTRMARRMERIFERILAAMYKNLGVERGFSINGRVGKLHVSGCDQKVMVNQGALDLGCAVEYLNGKKWHFEVVDTEKLSSRSWGGIIFVSTRNIFHNSETEVAGVMGHEIAHAVAQHGNEVFYNMMSGLSKLQIPIVSMIFDLIYKFLSRRQEFEADYIGLMIIAIAGYDPRTVAKGLLRKKSRKKNLFSEHPSNRRRGELLTSPQVMEKAMMLYEEAVASMKQDKSKRTTKRRRSIVSPVNNNSSMSKSQKITQATELHDGIDTIR